MHKNGQVIAAAAVRVHGALFAEIPFFAIHKDHRRQGNCRRLVAAIEGLLGEVAVAAAITWPFLCIRIL